jgi:Ca-activated chloride channel family protein
MRNYPRRTVAALAALTLGVGLAACSARDAESGNPGGGARAPEGGYGATPGVSDGGEVRTGDDPQSTFAVDVDTASYGYSRRLIEEGTRPDPADVRPEEFINAFRQDYPQPDGDGFAIHADGTRLPETHHGVEGTRLLRVGLQTRAEDRTDRRDAALTFVIDVSGSMAEPGRLDLAQDALHELVRQLRPTDSVAIVAFSSEARVVREMTRVAEKDRLHSAIDELRPEASTNLEDGLLLGYRVARDGYRPEATNRVIILSDGLANVGSTESAPIVSKIKEEARKQIALLGVGVGSQYGDRLMEQLADNGDGFVVYVADREQARKVFVTRLPSALSVRAWDAKVQVTFDPHAVATYRLIGYENRAVADQDFRDRTVDGGEVGPGHSVTALYEVRLTGAARPEDRVARVDVRWLDPRTRQASETTATVEVSDVDRSFATAPVRLRVCYVAGYLAERLRGGPSQEGTDLRHLVEIANRAADATEDPDVRALADLVVRTDRLY